MSNTIIRVFTNTNMALGHLSLKLLAAKAKVKSDNLEKGEFIIFLNKRQTSFKLLNGKLIVYFKNDNRRIDLNAIRYVPLVFNANDEMDVSYQKALEMALNEKLERKNIL